MRHNMRVARSTRAYVSLSILALVWLALLLAMPLSGARAGDISKADEEHARNALHFAEQSRWHDALLHAESVRVPAVRKLVQWLYYLEPNSGAGFEEISEFMRSNAHWPEQRKLQIRAEQALKYGDATPDALLPWFEAHPAITGIGKMAYAKALMHSGTEPSDETIIALVREAWQGGDFDEPAEDQIQSEYAHVLRQEDHRARIDRLVWEDKLSAAERMLPKVPDEQQKLFRTRMALIREERDAMQLLSQLSSSALRDPGLIYDRMQWRARSGDDEGVTEMLLEAPENPPYPQKWWKRREQQVRKAINRDQHGLARKLLANHGQKEGQELTEALWLSGWLALEFEKKPQRAYEEFAAIHNVAKFPNSRARGAYWAARAAEAAGKDDARGWYDHASAYPTTFYGQAAAAHQHKNAPLRFPAMDEPTAEAKRKFEQNELARAVRIAVDVNDGNLSQKLLQQLIESLDDPAQVELAARIGEDKRHAHLAVRGSKLAQQKNVMVTKVGYPRFRLPEEAAPEPSLILAVARQESEFNPSARSPAGAMGMMQLMPKTAKEVARKMKIGFSAGKLYDPHYNFRLGSAYLERLLGSYDGSYVMAIAAYNAGPGRVREWRDAFGEPGEGMESAIRWIERIPFTETRDYVQRVMANLQVYRHLESQSLTKLALAEDLQR